MAQGHSANPPLGLCSLARIIDDKGIDHRQIGQQNLGPAIGRQRHRFARQPFQRAMRTDMQQRMKPLRAQPQIKRHIAVARNPRQIMVIAIAGGDMAALGLQRDQGAARPQGRKVKRPRRASRILLWRAPSLRQLVTQSLRQLRQGGMIVLKRPRQPLGNQARPKRIGGRDIMPLRRHLLQNRLGRGQSIQAHRMRNLVRPPGVGRKHNRHRFFGHRRRSQPQPAQNPRHNLIDPSQIRAMRKPRELQIGVALAGGFKADQTGENPAIHLGQHHMHCQIRRGQPAL